MKPSHFIAPLLALGGSAAWIYSQEEPLTELQEQTKILRERITETKSFRDKSPDSGRTGSPGGKNAQTDKYLLPDGSLDWEAIAEVMKKNPTRMGGDMRLMLQLQQKMMEMTGEEIAENIAKIRALDLTDELRFGLESQLIQLLAQKDPETAMSLVSGSLDKKNSPQSWQMRHAFGEWARKDPSAAMSWMDKQVAEGKFISKSLDPSDNPRLEFETRLMGVLFYDDPAAVRKRLDQFSAAEQNRILQDHHVWRKDGKVTQEYLDLVRERGIEDQQASLVGKAVIPNVKQEGFESTSKVINQFTLSPEERKAAIDAAVDDYSNRWDGTTADPAEVYPWVLKEDPDRAAVLTAKALSNQLRMGQERFQSTFESALKISEDAGEPRIMEEFMKNVSNQGNLEYQLSQFKDDALRERYKALYEESK
ncbi:hypothetical protein N9A94_05935 [Akkermansiaceae bacterium]|nr:hypothetical protein [Akkermansiaceae bacterium]